MLCLEINKLKSPFLCVYDSIKVVLLFFFFFSTIHGWNYWRDGFQLLSLEKIWGTYILKHQVKKKKKTFQKPCRASRPRVSIIKLLSLGRGLLVQHSPTIKRSAMKHQSFKLMISCDQTHTRQVSSSLFTSMFWLEYCLRLKSSPSHCLKPSATCSRTALMKIWEVCCSAVNTGITCSRDTPGPVLTSPF